MDTREELFGTLFEAGRVVFSEGDPGDCMYIVQSGTVEIIRERAGVKERLDVMEAGDFFGEMALIDSSPRSATAVTGTRCRLLPVSRSSLTERISRDNVLVTALLEVFARRLARTSHLLLERRRDQTLLEEAADQRPVAAVLDPGSGPESSAHPVVNRLHGLLPESEPLAVNAGETVIRSGSTGDAMYLIKSGSMLASRRQDGRTVVLDILGPGEFFGEMALVGERTRTADVTALSDARLIVVERNQFDRVLSQKPAILLYLLQIMVLRLRRANERLEDPSTYRSGPSLEIPQLAANRDGVRTVALLSLSSCSGCMVRLLEEEQPFRALTESVEIVYGPLFMDTVDIPPCDVAVIDGLARVRDDVIQLERARERARYLVAWGTCAAMGGIPAVANSHDLEELVETTYGSTRDVLGHYVADRSGMPVSHRMPLLRRAGGLDEHVRIDFFIPGCPPEPSLLNRLLDEMRSQPGAVPGGGIVCGQCPKKVTREKAGRLHLHPDRFDSPDACFTSLGILCLGYLTRNACNAVCPRSGLPCWGCRGPSGSVMKRIEDGESEEQVHISSLIKRCDVSCEEASTVVNVSRQRANSPLNFVRMTDSGRSRTR